jgi:hypothetical protein
VLYRQHLVEAVVDGRLPNAVNVHLERPQWRCPASPAQGRVLLLVCSLSLLRFVSSS